MVKYHWGQDDAKGTKNTKNAKRERHLVFSLVSIDLQQKN